jgi:integrase
MAKKQKTRSEKYIHIEERSGSFRFKVNVGPHKRSATFSTEPEGWRWARQCRQVFLARLESDQLLGLPISLPIPVSPAVPTCYGFPIAHSAPAPIKLTDVFDSYEEHDLPQISGKDPEVSRLRKLRRWFGDLTVDQLDEGFITKWKKDRLAGKYGSGRDPNRAKTKTALDKDGNKPLTKHQRHYRKLKGKKVDELPIHKVSSQSVRHELGLLRRSISNYLERESRRPVYGMWWEAHYLKRMELPAQALPRRRRLSDTELRAIFDGIDDVFLKSAILFAVLTSLRRGEVISLQWEDVDFERKVVLLRKPDHNLKTKVNEREIPLMAGAVKVLKDLGPKDDGPIFELAASDVSHGWRDAADKAEIFDARLHDCRREAISRFVEACDLNIHQVVLFSGHTDTRTLEKHYLNLDAGRMASKLLENPNAINFAPSL